MRLLALALFFLSVLGIVFAGDAPGKDLPLIFEDDFAKGADHWQPTDPLAWKVTQSDIGQAYHMFKVGKYKPPHRSPLNISLIKDIVVTDFVFQAKVKSTGKDGPHRDMCLFFGYQDPAHFYYVHIAKRKDDHANQAFIVNAADRTKISKTTTAGTPWDDQWHQVKVVRNTGTGSIEIFFDDMKKSIITAEDKTFTWGQVGVGSFDDTGFWDDVKLYGLRKK